MGRRVFDDLWSTVQSRSQYVVLKLQPANLSLLLADLELPAHVLNPVDHMLPKAIDVSPTLLGLLDLKLGCLQAAKDKAKMPRK